MDELLIRQAPHSPEAEQAVLGSMLIDADCVKDVMDKLQPEDFYLRQNREIFETIYSMFSCTPSPSTRVTVAGEMERSGVYTDDTRGYLVQLMEVTPTSANVMEYVEHRPGQGPAAGGGRRRGGHHRHGPGGHRRGQRRSGGGGAENLRHPPGAAAAQDMVPISMVLQAVL